MPVPPPGQGPPGQVPLGQIAMLSPSQPMMASPRDLNVERERKDKVERAQDTMTPEYLTQGRDRRREYGDEREYGDRRQGRGDYRDGRDFGREFDRRGGSRSRGGSRERDGRTYDSRERDRDREKGREREGDREDYRKSRYKDNDGRDIRRDRKSPNSEIKSVAETSETKDGPGDARRGDVSEDIDADFMFGVYLSATDSPLQANK